MRVFSRTDTSLHRDRRRGVRENSRLASMERASPDACLADNSLIPACGPCFVDLSEGPDLGASLFQVRGVMALPPKIDPLRRRCTFDPLLEASQGRHVSSSLRVCLQNLAIARKNARTCWSARERVATTLGMRCDGWPSALGGWTDSGLGPSGTHPIGNVRHFVQQ